MAANSFFSVNPLSTRFPNNSTETPPPSTEHPGKAQTPDDEKMMDVPTTNDAEIYRSSIRKPRSVSDAPQPSSSRSSTPASMQRTGKDDISLSGTPATPQRRGSLAHGLALQMPARLSTGALSSGSPLNGAPLSPKLDSSHTYGSPAPASVLPRRSRGLDFSRASTNLHHSTLAQDSPDSSPSVAGRGVTIPQRKSSEAHNSHPFWSGSGYGERANISSSMSSVNMMDSDDSDSSDNDEDGSLTAFDRGDPMVMTPQASRTANPLSIALSPSVNQSPGGEWMHGHSAAKSSLMEFQRRRFRNSGHSSSSTSSKPSPIPISSPVMRSVETPASGYFSKDSALEELKTRRESLSLGTNDIHLSDISDDGGENKQAGISSPSSGSLASGSNTENARRGVVKRPVTRRGNLLVCNCVSRRPRNKTNYLLSQPKTKNFARIRAALFEECTPVESEVKREAEVVRQVRESDTEVPPLSPSLTTSASFSAGNPFGEITSGGPSSASGPQGPEPEQPGRSEFWKSLDSRYRTPPPTSNTDSGFKEALAEITGSMPREASLSRGSTPFTSISQMDVGDGHKRLNKRRRNDDLDLASFKRRAVSPAMSAQSSPILPHASIQVPKSVVHPGPEGTPHTGHTKRVGMQGMNETNDGLMKMSID